MHLDLLSIPQSGGKNVLSVAFKISPEDSNIPKKVFKMSRGVSYSFERGSLFQAFTSTS